MLGCIIVAAGYGSVREEGGRPFPKVAETVDGVPMIGRAIRAAEQSGISDVVVVVNPRDQDTVSAAIGLSIRSGAVLRWPTRVVQPERLGSADAVSHAIPVLYARGCERALITYGDMPLWSPETFRRLLASDSQTSAVTMVTVKRHPMFPVLNSYGRVLRDRLGKIERILEVNDPEMTADFRAIDRVNPSLWVWNMKWLEQAIPNIPPVRKPDGYGDERYMPPMIHMATRAGLRVRELPLGKVQSREARGVNSLDDLRALQAEYGA